MTTETGDDLKAVHTEVFRSAFAFGVMKQANVEKLVVKRDAVGPAGAQYLGGQHVEIDEWAIAGEIVARRVVACGKKLTWLRADLAELAEARIEQDHATLERDRDRIVADVMREVDRAKAARAEPSPLLSQGLIHAAMRHSRRIGRLTDNNSRGDEERGKFALLLERLAHEERKS